MIHILQNSRCCLLCLFLFICIGCNQDSTNSNHSKEQPSTLFQLLSSEQSGIDFNNEIIENERYNHILQDVVFNGGGVGILDVNNDGLSDIFFAGNQVSDRLYLNTGKGLEFEDISEKAGIKNDTWSSAVAIADVNGDGFDDIYVGKYLLADRTQCKNALYINNGDLTFTEKAEEYGIADPGYCTAVNFFDYDNDGDLDLYVGNQPHVLREKKDKPIKDYSNPLYTDRLFRFDDEKFTDVTDQAGIRNFNFTLSATAADLNNDGFTDIFVASDYEEPDYYWQNNGNGTFTNMIYNSFRHISNFSMGVDIADFNNDGFQDIYVADMSSADNFRAKTNMSGMNPEKFWQLANSGYHLQYMYNMLHLNNANGTFSDIGQLAGVASSDWSWATLFGDYDNDGDKDLLVANGQAKDIKNKDYMNRRKVVMDSLKTLAEQKGKPKLINSMALIEMAPSERLKNFIYENTGNLTFQNNIQDWGLNQPSWSQGAAYADLDNDGDMELIFNNINDEAFLYENHSQNNYLQIRCVGNQKNNKYAVGTKAWAFSEDGFQVLQLYPTRGYLSTSQPVLNFGFGDLKNIKKVVVEWPDGKRTTLNEVPTNQILTLYQKDAQAARNLFSPITVRPKMFKDASAAFSFTHRENDYDDYRDEILLPHRMSRLGPCLAKSDVNQDGLEDVFVGGASGLTASLFLQQSNGQFVENSQAVFQKSKASEDIFAHFFDADQDGDEDLYVVSGGNEFRQNSPNFQDRLYLNDGNGTFQKSNNLPDLTISGGVVKSADWDGDGDLDLFVGGRQVANKYGYAPPSFLLENQNGKFKDVTPNLAENFEDLGMVSDALWLDIDGDKDEDLLVAGEWMNLRLFQNENDNFKETTEEAGLANTSGWWNRLEKVDIDADGDLDVIAGNLGTNIKYKASIEQPFRAFVSDFDENGTNDIYLGFYADDGVCYPVRGRECSSQQMPFIKKEFPNYATFASAPIEDVLGKRKEKAMNLSAQLFESVILINENNGSFKMKILPKEAQISPVYGILPFDWNQDGHLDLLLTGNYFEREVETVRSDAGVGQVLLGDGKGGFEAISTFETGLILSLDARSALILNEESQKPLILVGNNNGPFQMYQLE